MNFFSTHSLKLLLLGLVSGAHISAHAEMTMSDVPTGFFYLSEAESGWYYDTYLGISSEPTYAGSKRRESEIEANARAFYVTETGDRYYFSLGELGGYWQLNKNLQFIAYLEYEEGRDPSDDIILTGFDEIQSTLEGQFFLVQRWGNTYASVILQPDFLERGKGLVWFAALGHDWFIKDNFRFTLIADISGANSTYMNTEFGISQRESDISGLSYYEPSSGLKSFSTAFEAEYKIDKNWSLLSSVEWEYYLDVAADSPLIKDEGDKSNLTANLLVRYAF